MTKQIENHGTVDHEGIVIELTQEAWPDTAFEMPGQPEVFRAEGVDSDGNKYRITWLVKKSIIDAPETERPDDLSLFCNWAQPTDVQLVEEA